MKAKFSSILLSALVCSTLGLDYLSARRFALEDKSSRKSISPFSNFRERSAVSEQCAWVCEGGSNNSTGSELQLIVNATTDLVGVVNVTAGVAFVLDVRANLVALFNGTSGAVIVVNIETGSGIYIAAGQSTSVWISSGETFEIYFKSLTSLQVIFNLKVGTTFEISSVSTVILYEIGTILSEFSNDIRLQIQGDFKLSLSILMKISSSFSAVFKGALKGILKFFDEEVITIYWDIIWLVQIFRGLETVILRIDGGLETLIKAGVRFHFKFLFASVTGIELFINLLLSIVANVDLTIIRGINDPSQLLHMISVLTGYYASGINGVFQIIDEIAYVNEGSNESIRNFIKTLLKFSTSTDFTQLSSETLVTIAGGLKNIADIQESQYSSSISGITRLAEQLQNGTFRIGMFPRINNLLEGPVYHQHLRFVVRILLALRTIIKPPVAISTLVLCLVSSLTNIIDINIVKIAIPDLSINVHDASNGVIIKNIFKGVSSDIIISLCKKEFDLIRVLTTLPIIGKIYSSVSIAVKIESNGNYTLADILKSHSAVAVQEIEAWIKWASHVRCDTTSSTTGGAIDASTTSSAVHASTTSSSINSTTSGVVNGTYTIYHRG